MRQSFVAACCALLISCGGGEGGDVSKGTGEIGAKGLSGTQGAWLKDVLSSYYGLKSALVDADSTRADSMAAVLKSACDSALLPSPVNDSATFIVMGNLLGDLSSECSGFGREPSLEARRRSFNMMGEHLYPLLQTAGYNGGQVYRQVCPMAFNDNEKAGWLSDSREIVNPYLGRKHPKYSSGMLHCGELEDSLTKAK